MSPTVRKFGLTAHIVASVGWLGSVVGFLSLALASLLSPDTHTLRASYIAMDWTARFVIVPFSFASIVTGLVQSLGTKWGLFRHYWVVAKLLINVFANIVLLMYMPTLSYLRSLALETTMAGSSLEQLRDPSPVVHSTAALGLLVIATVLGVYKPSGLTAYGWRKQQQQSTLTAARV